MDSSTPPETAAEPPTAAAGPVDWSEALGTLISSRIALIQLESRAASRQARQLAAVIAGAAVAACFTWALVLAGGIAALAAATGWPWYWLALAAAAGHALVAAVCLRLAGAARAPAFPITRAEFQKDREWLDTLKIPRKSND